jgi:hypothetical protein
MNSLPASRGSRRRYYAADRAVPFRQKRRRYRIRLRLMAQPPELTDGVGELTKNTSTRAMKPFLILLFLHISMVIYGQRCSCEEAPQLKDVISCEVITFSNKAKLYRQFNCDSSWLTFEGRSGKKVVLYSWQQPLVELTERLGYQFARENKQSFLIMNRLVSGCCTPPEYILFNKSNGKQLRSLGKLIHHDAEGEDNFALYFSDSMLNSVTLLFLNTGKQYEINLPRNRFNTSLEKTGEHYAESMFYESQVRNRVFTIAYRYQVDEEAQKWYEDKIEIDLKKYAR